MIDFLRRSWTDQNCLLHEVIEKQDKEMQDLKQEIEMLRRWRG
jgi:cell division protein FtsB